MVLVPVALYSFLPMKPVEGRFRIVTPAVGRWFDRPPSSSPVSPTPGSGSQRDLAEWTLPVPVSGKTPAFSATVASPR